MPPGNRNITPTQRVMCMIAARHRPDPCAGLDDASIHAPCCAVN